MATWIDRSENSETIAAALILAIRDPAKLQQIAALLKQHAEHGGKKKRRDEYDRLFEEVAAEIRKKKPYVLD